ncbi:MAG: fibronectin type III domain-containing protein [Acidobacteria bacterium]|nr:fibronectin type III domain-containing protein [Acidobacteriota bacterium]
MKTMVSILGTILLAGAVALAQTGSSGTAKTTKKNSNSSDYSSASSNTGSSTSSGVTAGNSGFDASDNSQTPSSSNSATSSQNGSSAYGSSNPGSSSASTQYGSSSEQTISNGPVAETVGDSSALIGWATKNPASSTGLKYGTNRANMTETAQGTDGADGKNHHARLQGLSPSTRYYFQVTENGQPVGGVGTFKTTASGETPVQSKAVIPQK